MANPPKKQASRQRRGRGELSKTSKALYSYDAAAHLGNKKKHAEDVAKQQEWMLQQKARKLGVSSEDLDEGRVLDQVLEKTEFSGGRTDDALMGKSLKDDKQFQDILGNRGLILSTAFIGEPGSRKWVDLEGIEWVGTMMHEKQTRSNYVTASRNHVTRSSQALQVIMARLPPWSGREVGPVLLNDPDGLRTRLKRICADFSERYNVDVVGAVVHRESDHDLHIHLVFTQTRERIVTRKTSVREVRSRKKAALDQIRAERKKAGKPATNRDVARIFNERVKAGDYLDPYLNSQFVEYQRIKLGDEKVHRNVMGHSFRSKYQIWQAAENSDKTSVAALRDRDPALPRSFRNRILGSESRGEVLTDFWWDLWLAERWQAICLDKLAPEIVERVATTGKEMARNFIEFGTTIPSLVEQLAVEKTQLAETLVRLEEKNTTLQCQLDVERDKPIPTPVVEIPADLTAALEKIPAEHRKDSNGETISSLVVQVASIKGMKARQNELTMENAELEKKVTILNAEVTELKGHLKAERDKPLPKPEVRIPSHLARAFDALPRGQRKATDAETVSWLSYQVTSLTEEGEKTAVLMELIKNLVDKLFKAILEGLPSVLAVVIEMGRHLEIKVPEKIQAMTQKQKGKETEGPEKD